MKFRNKKWITILVMLIIGMFAFGACDTDADKDSSLATEPPAPVTVTKGAASTATSLVVDWGAGAFVAKTHLTNKGVALTAAQVKYKVYVIAKVAGEDKTPQQVKDAVTKPIEVGAGIVTATIASLITATPYEVVVEAINTTDYAKTSLSPTVTLTTN